MQNSQQMAIHKSLSMSFLSIVFVDVHTSASLKSADYYKMPLLWDLPLYEYYTIYCGEAEESFVCIMGLIVGGYFNVL